MRRYIFIFIFLFMILIFNSNTLSADSYYYNKFSIFTNPLNLFLGEITLGSEYFFNYDIAINFSLNIVSSTLSNIKFSGVLFSIGLKYFFGFYNGFSLFFDLSTGNIKFNNYQLQMFNYSFGLGYRLTNNVFFIEPMFGIVISSIISVASFANIAFGIITGLYL